MGLLQLLLTYFQSCYAVLTLIRIHKFQTEENYVSYLPIYFACIAMWIKERKATILHKKSKKVRYFQIQVWSVGKCDDTLRNVMYIGPCIIVIVEECETNLMSQFIMLYFTSSMLNMFRILIHPSSGACDIFILSSHLLCVLVSMCVGVSEWLVGVVSV